MLAEISDETLLDQLVREAALAASPDEFLTRARAMAANRNGAVEYYSVSDLRYTSSPSLPRVVVQKIQRFILEQGDSDRIQRLFGVKPLGRNEYEVVAEDVPGRTRPGSSPGSGPRGTAARPTPAGVACGRA